MKESDENSKEEEENVVDVVDVPSTSYDSEQSRSCGGVRRSVRIWSRTAGAAKPTFKRQTFKVHSKTQHPYRS